MLLLLAVLILVQLPSLIEALRLNLKFITIKNWTTNGTVNSLPVDTTTNFGEKLLANPSSHRLEGLAHLAVGELDSALSAFTSAGWTNAEYIAMSNHFKVSDTQRAFTWLSLAMLSDPTDPVVLVHVGELCRKDWQQDDICAEFLAQNGGNYLINADFAVANFAGWQQVETEADYLVVSCPGQEDVNCAQITTTGLVELPPAGVGQCFQINPGQVYRFSTWLKVETSPNGIWRPLYFQGIIDGKPSGTWIGDQSGPIDWQYWELELVGPTLDDGQGCFNPIRLLADGVAWFFNSAVVDLSGTR